MGQEAGRCDPIGPIGDVTTSELTKGRGKGGVVGLREGAESHPRAATLRTLREAILLEFKVKDCGWQLCHSLNCNCV